MRRKKIGYLGPKGTFSHEAAHIIGKGKALLVPMQSFRDIVLSVKEGGIDEGLVPVENLHSGHVADGIDAIIAGNGDVLISAEMILPVTQCLVGCAPCEMSKINKVFSIGPALAQCRNWLHANIPLAELAYADSTAAAIQDLDHYGSGAAAVGSEFAAQMYGRVILRKGIQDANGNATHFLVLRKKDSKRQGNDKTSLVFTTLNKPGALVRVLEVFNALDINMIKIESRPSRNRMHEYIFWADIEGHRNEPKVKTALDALRNKVEYLLFLGSYPKAVN